MAEEQQNDDWNELRMDVEDLSEWELDDLARLVVRKLRESMRDERDRAGRF